MPAVTPETARFFLDLFVPERGIDGVDVTAQLNEMNEEEEDLFAVLQTTLCPN